MLFNMVIGNFVGIKLSKLRETGLIQFGSAVFFSSSQFLINFFSRDLKAVFPNFR